MANAKKRTNRKTASVTVGYEAALIQMAGALRGSMDADEYKHVALGLIFLRDISDAFEEQHAELEAQRSAGADPEDPDEYRALSIHNDRHPDVTADFILAKPPFNNGHWPGTGLFEGGF